MPALPKFGDGRRFVGRIEVLRELESDHQPQTHRHVGIAAEVEIDLERIGHQAAPRAGESDGGLRKSPIGHGGDGIGQQHLFGQSQHEQGDAGAGFRPAVGAHPELFVQFVIAHDRTRHQLGKQGHIAGEIDETLRRAGLAAIDVDRIAHRLERVE